MTRPFEAERKAIRKAANTTTALSDALKASRDAAERIDANPFAALIAANEARRHCKALAGLADQLGLVDAALADLATRAESLGERAKARLVGEGVLCGSRRPEGRLGHPFARGGSLLPWSGGARSRGASPSTATAAGMA